MARTKGSLGKHKKVKEPKEKKKRGRKQGSIKQKQEQHQVVNVNINSSSRKKRESSEEREGKKKKREQRQFQNPIPNIIFNPSIAIPQGFPVNKSETNPPYFDMNSLMQPIQQAIKNNQPTNPIFKPTDVKPTVINPQPVQPIPIGTQTAEESNAEKYTPNPQTDQSHPLITPELIIDSNVSSSIHNKHMQHKEIQPEVPKEIPKPKYKDTEGLGKRIPIQNIGAIASTIASGGALGGATAAGEALIAGGFSGLLGAGESIAASAVGGGVAAGVNSGLGGGDIAHIASGIAGGIAGRAANRTASRRVRNRVRLDTEASTENQPLFTGRGNAVGGSRTGRSRLVEDSEIQPVRDPQTGETTNWVFPATEPTIIRNIRKAAKRTMRAASETVSDIKNQISEAGGNIVDRVRGRPRLVPRSDTIEPYEPHEVFETIEETNAKQQLIPFLKRNAQKNKLKSMRWDNEMQQNETNRKAANSLTAAIKRSKQQIDYEQELLIDRENESRKPKSTISQSAVLPENASELLNKQKAAKKLQDMIKLKQGEKGRHILQKVVRENIAVRKIQKGRQIFEERQQKKYNDYLQNAASTNFNTLSQKALQQQQIEPPTFSTLSKKALKRQQEQLQTELKKADGISFIQGIKQEKTANKLLKLSQGATNELKERWKSSVKQHQQNVSKFGQLTHKLQQEQSRQRLDIASIQPVQLQGGTRSGAAFSATREQLNAPSRMQLHRERNPELTQLRQQLSDFKRGKTQLSDIQVGGIETRIQQLVEINKALRKKGMGPQVGRPRT
jgi:hypothetical protein